MCGLFENEYYFGDFYGDVNGLLCYGYDVYLYYVNFGVWSIVVRLLVGMFFLKLIWLKYMGIGEFIWKKDVRGNVGNLLFNLYYEVGEFEEIWFFCDFMDDVVEFCN